jgi:hypothetical protein
VLRSSSERGLDAFRITTQLSFERSEINWSDLLGDPQYRRKTMKFRKKPVIIEAFQMTPERRTDNSEWPAWLHEAWQKPVTETGAVFHNADGCLEGELTSLFIQTLEGTRKIEWGDYIIQGEQGELYSRKPDIFDETHEPVLSNAPALPPQRSGGRQQQIVGTGLEENMKGVVIRQLGENYWTAYDNSSGRNEREGYGKTRNEAIADFKRKSSNAGTTGRKERSV